MEELAKNIAALLRQAQSETQKQLTAIEAVVFNIIKTNNTDTWIIEQALDSLLDMQFIGLGKETFLQLLEYYKTLDREAAKEYWDIFDEIG
ncbi:MAG: hypothetical protein IPN76_34610 [Saprospiraceae bacterium]|nr:hypothetical protein [Saprospiraceae bacterium]